MPKVPIALGIVPSRLALWVHGLLAAAVVAPVVLHAPAGIAVLVTLVLAGVVVWVARRRPRGELRGVPRPGGGLRWSWRSAASGGGWQEVTLRCDYLGPWLIGLRLDGRRLWLWPDSGDAASLRGLRRVLVALA
jgi:toxin CptA